MLRAWGFLPLPAGTLRYLTSAIVCLVAGFLLGLVASATSWASLRWAGLAILAAGAFLALLAVRRAASG